MAHKKGQGSSKNGRESNSKRLGLKVADGEYVRDGAVLVRQRGSKFHLGHNVYLGKDFTLHAGCDGKVKFSRHINKRGHTYRKASVFSAEPNGSGPPTSHGGKGVIKQDLFLRPDASRSLRDGAFGAKVVADERALLVPVSVESAARADYVQTAAALVTCARCSPDDLAERLKLTEKEIQRHLDELLLLLRPHLPEDLLEPPRPLDVRYGAVSFPKPPQ